MRRFFKNSASSKQVYLLREQLTAILNKNLSKQQAQSKIRGWIQKVQNSGLNCSDNFLKLLNSWREEITNYFIQRENSGFMEGFNNKVKILKRRRCYGIFRQRRQAFIPAHLLGLAWLSIIRCHRHTGLNRGNSQRSKTLRSEDGVKEVVELIEAYSLGFKIKADSVTQKRK